MTHHYRREKLADDEWRPYINWFTRHQLLSRAKRWLQSNPRPREFTGSSWHYAYLNMPMLAMEITPQEARLIFSDQPKNNYETRETLANEYPKPTWKSTPARRLRDAEETDPG